VRSVLKITAWITLFTAHAAAQTPSSSNDFSPDLFIRGRYEFTDWLKPLGSSSDPGYSYAHTKFQVGLKYNRPKMKAYVQGQYFQLYDLPDNGSGPGTAYFTANDKDHSPGDVGLRQAYLNVFGDTASATAGRFLYSNGMEGLSKNNTVVQLRQKRVSERVIGPFDFTGGRSFDGLRLGWSEQGAGAFDVAAFRPTQGGFATDSSSEIEDIFLLTSALSAAPEVAGTADLQLFYYFYRDGRGPNVVKADNRPLDSRKLDEGDISIHNVGFHAIDVYSIGGLQFDWLVWGLAQSGDWGALDHTAFANAVEGGVRLEEVRGKPWFRVGWNWSTGDSDKDDTDHHTFFQLLPTARLYAETPFYNLMNNQELFLNVAVDIADGFNIKAGASYLCAAQAEDLLYSGGGASTETQFGYGGASLAGSRELGTLASLQASYKFSSSLTVGAYYGHLFGQDGLDAAFSNSSLDYGFLEAIVKY
jgi:hypothetical protein